MENDTIFGKIIRGELPATKVYEDEKCLAFLDINPVTKGHTLLIPKEQYRWIQDVPDELLGYLFITSKKIIDAQLGGLSCDYVQVVVEGKDVPHFHIHLIPSLFDHKTVTWEHEIYADEEIESTGEKIRNALN